MAGNRANSIFYPKPELERDPIYSRFSVDTGHAQSFPDGRTSELELDLFSGTGVGATRQVILL